MKHIHHSDPSEYWHQSQREHSAGMAIKVKPSYDEVARKAYEIYQMEGCPQGRDVQHWLEAEIRLGTIDASRR